MSATKVDNTSTQIMGKNGELPPRILVVDDDDMIRNMLYEILHPEGFHIDMSHSSGDALERLIDYNYNLLLLDANLPGISGFELLKYCKKHHPAMEIIMITGNPELDDAISTVKDGAFDYIAKPFSVEKLLSRVYEAIKFQKDRLKKESLTGTESLDTANVSTPLPDYKVVRTLGAGTMGVVLLVEKNNQKFALKILRKEGDEVAHAAKVKRFLREAEILSQIDHPNVVKIYDSGFPHGNDVPYILMEYVEGHSLIDYIKDNDLLPLKQKLYIIAQIASALAIVHKFGVLHRDVKPSNILITDANVAKLSDFGIARISDSSLTMTHEVLGSPAYMPPESFNSKRVVDNRSDIFSLGILAYELLTGVKPFQGETVGEMMSAIQHLRPIEPRKIKPDLPQVVQDLLANMLHKAPEERYQSATKIVTAINNLEKNDGSTTDTKSLRFIRSMLSGSSRVWE
jgi:serine/threonine-protein kinase